MDPEAKQMLHHIRQEQISQASQIKTGFETVGQLFKRQQQFLRALFEKVSSERNPLELNEMMSSVAAAVRIDDQTSMTDALELANRIRTGLPESVELPTRPTTVGSAAVLVLADGSEDVLTLFR